MAKKESAPTPWLRKVGALAQGAGSNEPGRVGMKPELAVCKMQQVLSAGGTLQTDLTQNCKNYTVRHFFVYAPRIAYYRAMKHIGTHLQKKIQNSKETERGELMKYFCARLNASRTSDGLPPISMGRMGKLLQQIPTKDLYYLKRVCDDATNFSKKFWYELNPEKYESKMNKKPKPNLGREDDRY